MADNSYEYETSDSLPGLPIEGAKEAIDKGFATFERKQKLRAKRKKTWKYVKDDGNKTKTN